NNQAMVVALIVPGLVSFYERFGFEFAGEARGDDGRAYPRGLLKASGTLIDECREALAHRRITYPDVRNRIPDRSADPPQAGADASAPTNHQKPPEVSVPAEIVEEATRLWSTG